MGFPFAVAVSAVVVGKKLARRTRNAVVQFAQVRHEPEFRVFLRLLVLLGALLGVVWLAFPTFVEATVARVVAGIIGTIVGVYFSLDVLRRYSSTIERRRIAPSEEIIDYYDDVEFIELDEMACWSDKLVDAGRWNAIARKLPRPLRRVFTGAIPTEAAVTVEDAPTELRPISDYEVRLTGSMYRIPADLEALLEPYVDELRSEFRAEKRKNGIRVRLDDVHEDEFFVSKTSYYRSFLTNFCPDYDLGNGYTLRGLVQSSFPEQGAGPLSKSLFSNHFGGGGLVVTTDGKALLTTRAKTVAVEGNSQHLSFSGSFRDAAVEEGGIEQAIFSVLNRETGIEEADYIETYNLGITRRIERLGKPDIVTLVLVDEDANWSAATDQFLDIEAVPLFPDEEVTFQSLEKFFRDGHAQTALRQLLHAVASSPYRPSLGLMSMLYLLDSLAESMADTSE